MARRRHGRGEKGTPSSNRCIRRHALVRRVPVLAIAALLSALSACGRGASEQAAPRLPATAVAVQRSDAHAVQRHAQIAVLPGREGVRLVFLGDSITERWQREGKRVFERFYGARAAANLGVAGDRTQNVIGRIEQGELERMRPELLVLLIGTNNVRRSEPQDVARAVLHIVRMLRERLPATRVLLLGLLPRGRLPSDPLRQRVARVNALLAGAPLGEGVEYLDLGGHFLQPDGTIAPSVMPDFLHLSEQGYAIWARAMEPTIARRLDE